MVSKDQKFKWLVLEQHLNIVLHCTCLNIKSGLVTPSKFLIKHRVTFNKGKIRKLLTPGSIFRHTSPWLPAGVPRQPTKLELTWRACGKATRVCALLFGGAGGTKCHREIHLKHRKIISVPSFLSVPGQLRVLERQSIMAGNLQWGAAHLPAAPQQGEASWTRYTPYLPGLEAVRWNEPFLPQEVFGHGVSS